MKKLTLLVLALSVTLAGSAYAQAGDQLCSSAESTLTVGQTLMLYPTTYRPAQQHTAEFYRLKTLKATRRYFPHFNFASIIGAADASVGYLTVWVGSDSCGAMVTGAVPFFNTLQADSMRIVNIVNESMRFQMFLSGSSGSRRYD